jgi:hypothetical protein
MMMKMISLHSSLSLSTLSLSFCGLLADVGLVVGASRLPRCLLPRYAPACTCPAAPIACTPLPADFVPCARRSLALFPAAQMLVAVYYLFAGSSGMIGSHRLYCSIHCCSSILVSRNIVCIFIL